MPNTFMSDSCGCNTSNMAGATMESTYTTNMPYYDYNMPSNYYTSNMMPYQYGRVTGKNDRIFGLFPFALGLGAGGLLFGPRFYPPYPIYPPMYPPVPFY